MSGLPAPTLGYLIEELEACEHENERAATMRPAYRATMKVEDVHGHIQQQLNAGFVQQQARERQQNLRKLPGFDRLQVYCETKWGEGVTLQNARRMRGAICQSGVKLDQATEMTLEQVANALEKLPPELTPAERRLWQQDFQERYARLIMSLPEDEARRRAEQHAWSQLGFEPQVHDAATSVKQKTTEPTTVEKKLSPAAEAAYQSYVLAQDQFSEVPTDKQAYGWLKENGPDDYDLPSFETWQRHVRSGRRHYGTQKNSPRANRSGRSIVDHDDL